MAAVFPALAACQENQATGPIEIPDHPIVRQTLDDCLNEAMDAAALEELVRGFETERIRTHFVDSTEPSPLAHEILNSRPYTFLDDAPLEERRTRAIVLRRGLPVDARELARLDPDAIARVREEARPLPRDADELHDLLLSMVLLEPVREWQPWLDALVAAGRACVLEARLGDVVAERWVALERRAAAQALHPTGSFSPDAALPPALAGLAPPDAEQSALAAVRGVRAKD